MLFFLMEDWCKLYIVYCGVEFECYVGELVGGKKLLFVGWLVVVKGMFVLLDVMKCLFKGVMLIVIGDGLDCVVFEE